MDDLGDLIAGELGARARATVDGDLPALYSSLRKRTKRRRAARATGAAALGAVVSTGLALGAYGAFFMGDDPAPAATAPSPTPTQPVEPVPTLLPLPDPTPYEEPAHAISSSLPSAPWVTDQLWAQVDDGWKLALFAFGEPPVFARVDTATTPQALYLVAPDGTYYVVRELDFAVQGILRWRIHAREVVLDVGDYAEGGLEGEIRATLDLDTGAVSLVRSADYVARFSQLAPDGREVWYLYTTGSVYAPIVEMYDPVTRTYDRENVGSYSALYQPGPSDYFDGWPTIERVAGINPSSSVGVWNVTTAGRGFSVWDVPDE